MDNPFKERDSIAAPSRINEQYAMLRENPKLAVKLMREAGWPKEKIEAWVPRSIRPTWIVAVAKDLWWRFRAWSPLQIRRIYEERGLEGDDGLYLVTRGYRIEWRTRTHRPRLIGALFADQ